MRRIVVISLLALLAGCATIVYDGAYEQVEGRAIDHASYTTLTEGKTTPDQALALFGPPDAREVLAQGYEQLSWQSVRAHTNVKRVGGKVQSTHRSRTREILQLQFYDGRLVHKSLRDDSMRPQAADCTIPRHCE